MKKLVNAAGLACSLLIFLLLAGCASSATQYVPLPQHLNAAPAPGQARICVIRGFLLAAMALENHVQEDGVPRGDLINGSYICWERPPGVTHLALGDWDNFYYRGNLPVEADMVYYLYMDYFSPQLKSITPQEGQKYLTEYAMPQVLAGKTAQPTSYGHTPPAGLAQPAGTQGGGPESPASKRIKY